MQVILEKKKRCLQHGKQRIQRIKVWDQPCSMVVGGLSVVRYVAAPI